MNGHDRDAFQFDKDALKNKLKVYSLTQINHIAIISTEKYLQPSCMKKPF